MKQKRFAVDDLIAFVRQQPEAKDLTDTIALAEPLAVVHEKPLGKIPEAQAARVVRRIVDGEALLRRLDVAAFNSAP